MGSVHLTVDAQGTVTITDNKGNSNTYAQVQLIQISQNGGAFNNSVLGQATLSRFHQPDRTQLDTKKHFSIQIEDGTYNVSLRLKKHKR